MKQFLFLFVSIHIFLNMHLHGHGFRSDVLVDSSHQSSNSMHISKLHYFVIRHNKHPLLQSMDVKKPANYFRKEIKSAARGTTNCYIKIWFDDKTEDDVVCTPLQEFYHVEKNSWMSGLELKAGDEVLSLCNRKKKIHKIEFVPEPLEVYALEIKKTHTFFVGRHGVLTHNMAIPFVLTAGFTIPFSIGTATSLTTVVLGPIALIGSVALGAAALGVLFLSKNADYKYDVKLDIGKLAQAYKEGYSYDCLNHKSNACDRENFWKDKRYYHGDEAVAPGIEEEKPEENKEEQDGKKTKGEEEKEAIEDVFKDAKPGKKTRGPTTQFEKPGDIDEALEDFIKINPDDVKNIPTGFTGVLQDGRKINVRIESTDGRPTLEIQEENDQRTKIRYGNK